VGALFANTRQMDLPETMDAISQLKVVIANELRLAGLTDVVNTPGEVAGNRAGVRLSVLHLPIAGRSFWQIVMAGGDAVDPTRQAVDDVVQRIRNLHFL
jgi:hypothetical protein